MRPPEGTGAVGLVSVRERRDRGTCWREREGWRAEQRPRRRVARVSVWRGTGQGRGSSECSDSLGGPGLAAEERVTLVGREGERENARERESRMPAMLLHGLGRPCWEYGVASGCTVGRVDRRGEKGFESPGFYHDFCTGFWKRADSCP